MAVRKILLFVLVVGSCVAATFFHNAVFDGGLKEEPTILVVGDFTDPDSFGQLVQEGVHAAVDESKLDFPAYIKIVPCQIRESSTAGDENTNVDQIRSLVTREVAHRNVIAVISANTSQTAASIIDACQVLRVPVFLAVATNDDLLHSGIENVYRLPARDTLQAQAIEDWCSRASGSGATAILYDPHRYGAALRAAITRSFLPLSLLTSSMGTSGYRGRVPRPR